MKKLLVTVMVLLASAVGAYASQADELYEKGNFAQALTAYQQIAQTATGADLYKAQLRIIASQYMLGQYLNAAKTAFTTPLPVADKLAQARLLLYRIHTAQAVANRYRPILNTSDEEQGEFEQLSAAQWQDKINESFEDLWKLRTGLINAPIEQETLILNLKDTDTKAVPTLFDFVVLQWKEQLQNKAPATPLRAQDMVTLSYKGTTSSKTDLEKLASILAQAAKLGGLNREDARLIWEADRLLLPIEHPDFFTFTDKNQTQTEIIQLLETLAGYPNVKQNLWSKITRAFRSPKADYGKAYAIWHAANQLDQRKEYEAAITRCQWAKENLADNYYNQSCQNLATSIQEPVLTADSTPFTQNPTHTQIPFTTRNVNELYVRLYSVSETDLKNWGNEKNSWNYLTYIPSEKLPLLFERTPISNMVKPLSYEKPYAFLSDKLTLPELTKPGFYAVVLSYDKRFDASKSPVVATVINQTELALFVTAAIEGNPADYRFAPNKILNPNVFRIYTLNLKTGQPQANAAISYFTDWQGSLSTGKTDTNGLLTLPRQVQLGKYNSYSVLPKATKNNSTAFLTNRASFYFSASTPLKVFAETDRAIYRPGQTVQIAVYGFEEAGRGWKTLPEKSQIEITVRDSNYEKVFTKTLSLNAYGTAQTTYTLPETGLLGSYSIEVSSRAKSKTSTGHAHFQVEEYKRPEYEVNLDAAAALQFGKETTLSGSAMYYFGAPVTDGSVEYTVTRQIYRPPFWWWRFVNDNEEKQIVSGNIKTDKDGRFTIRFTPQAGTDKTWPYVFKVQVAVRDDSGRSIEAEKTYKASEQAVFFAASFDKGFYDANIETVLARVQLKDINGQPIKGKFSAEIVELENTFSPAEASKQYYANSPSLEQWYGKNKELQTISKRIISASQTQESIVSIPALPEGIYQLKLSAKNAEEASFVFLVAKAQNSQLALPAVAIAQQQTYYPGSAAKILMGANALQGPKYIEVYDDGQFLARKEKIEKGVSVYSLPIQNAWRGGVYVRWFGASNYHLYNEQTFIDIPHDNKALSITADIPAAVKPGQKVAWPMQVRNAAGAPVNAQAAVRVYDKSLDYYAAISPAFTLEQLYPKSSSPDSISDSERDTYAQHYFTGKSTVTHLSTPQMPTLNLQRYFGRYAASFGAPRMLMTKSLAKNTNTMEEAAPMALADMAFGAQTVRSTAEVASKNEETSKDAGELPRTDFSETAYFNSMLALPGGKGEISFTLPQSLTGWNIQALAFTPDVNIGTFTAQTVTRKDLMVRLSLPRFWREGDQTTLVTQVTNLSNKKQTAEVTLDLLVDGKNAAAAFGIEKVSQTVSIPAQGNTAVTWPVSVPSGVGIATITATVRAGQESDAESRQLPLLPSKERLAESVTAALESGSQTLQLKNLLIPDETRQVSSVTLRVDPSLLLSVLNAMPQLLRPSYEDALSVVNRYVPLAVLNSFYHTYPLLQDAVGKLPKRNTQLPAWDSTDPSRLLLLEETPWLNTARGAAMQEEFLTDLFNPTAVEKTRTQMEKKLAKYQTSSGGFSWMPGGEPSEFITLRILAAQAQILRYGGTVAQGSTQKALAWLAPRVEKNLLDSTGSAAAVSYALYAAYVFTAYPQTWKAVQKAPVKKWLAYADKHAAYMTPLGQTYAAAAYYRLGENTKAQNYLDLVLSQMKTDPVTGAYFAPEAQSWLWYNDTLTTQTATLRTLLEIRPESDKAADLVKWLLFNRKAQAWRDSTATAQAVYTLLEYMQRKGLLDDPAEYQLDWGEQHTTLYFQPMDWSGKLSWTQEAANVPAEYYTAQVTKRGGLTGFVSLDAVYTTAQAKASQPGVLQVQRRYLLKYQEDGRDKVREIAKEEAVAVGSEIEVQLTLTATSAFDFVLLSDPKPAGFENTELLSGWTWGPLSMYREVRDGATNFFMDRIPAGTYTLRYTLRPTLAGHYHALPAQVQSMYAPEFSAHTQAAQIEVR